jgi:DNA mismatch repair protein MLH1
LQVEDLFYNIPTRRRAFRSAGEEYAKILDLTGRYAVHCAHVSFSCKKHGEPVMGISVPAQATTVERIRQIHGSAVANEIIQVEASSERWGFKAQAWISNANYSVKKTTFILFINHRSVESSAVKRAVEQTYSTFLPKGGHPFIYLSIEIEPHRVDVNIHPTKREVNFLNQDEIIESICDEMRAALGTVDTSRTFMTQTLLPNVSIQSSKSFGAAPLPSRLAQTPRSNSNDRPFPNTTPRPYDNDLVRTDARERKITSMFKPSLTSGDSAGQAEDDIEYEVVDKTATVCRLKSVKDLRAEVRDSMHSELTDIFATHAFVGLVDPSRRITAIQGGVKLYLVDYAMISNEYFYQLGLTDFGNFGSIQFTTPLDLAELLGRAVEDEQQKQPASTLVDWNEVISMVRARLIDRRDMLLECFSIAVSEDGLLLGMPLLIKGYTPAWTKLPNFLLRMGPYVNWDDEKPCFESILRELANFYVPEALPAAQADTGDPYIVKRREVIEKALENIIFPAFKARLVATKGLLKGVVEIANLKGLYRVFERC